MAECACRDQLKPVARLTDLAVPDPRAIPRFRPAILILGAMTAVLLGSLAGSVAVRVRGHRARRSRTEDGKAD